MKKPTWRPEDGQLLLSLREKAGIDAFVFVRTNTISLSQLKELETAEGNCFYNAQIKYCTGVKLLKNLGHELPAEPALENAETNPSTEFGTDANQHKSAAVTIEKTAETRTFGERGALKAIAILLLVLTLLATVFFINH